MDLLAGPSLLAAPLRRVCGGCDSPEIQQPLHAESGAALIADDRVAHLMAFPVVGTQ